MNIVKQETDVSCFLACIESFLKDNGVCITQQQMFAYFGGLQPPLCDKDGYVDDLRKMMMVCDRLGLSLKGIKYAYPIPDVFSDGSLLIGTSKPGRHMVRYKEPVSTLTAPEKILVMDPKYAQQINEYRYFDYPDLNDSEPDLYVIKMEKILNMNLIFVQ
jgi:hypothetical protein